ncbi:MAG: hypothetical protein ACE5J3_02700 [Methanosarcinales archaeon]
MEDLTLEKLIEIIGDKELAERLWKLSDRLENNPVWQKNIEGHDCVSILGR